MRRRINLSEFDAQILAGNPYVSDAKIVRENKLVNILNNARKIFNKEYSR